MQLEQTLQKKNIFLYLDFLVLLIFLAIEDEEEGLKPPCLSSVFVAIGIRERRPAERNESPNVDTQQVLGIFGSRNQVPGLLTLDYS